MTCLTSDIINIFMAKFSSFHDPVRLDFINQKLNWHGSDTSERYHSTGNRIFSDYDITYDMNAYGFRCDQFDTTNQYPNLAYLGCSVTEGIGLPSQDTWAYRLHSEIKGRHTDKHLPFYNLGMGGASLDQIARMVTQVWPILQPKVVFAHLPDPYRKEVAFDKTVYSWMSNMPFEDRVNTTRLFIDDSYTTYQIEKNFCIMQEYFTKYNTTCFYTYWTNVPKHKSTIHYEEILGTRYPNFKKIDTLFLYSDKARDNMHPGKIANSTHASNVNNLTRDLVDEILNCNK